MVERLLCKQDVSGSSPLTSTDPTPKDTEMCLEWRDFRRCSLEEFSLSPFQERSESFALVALMLNSERYIARCVCSEFQQNLDNCIGESGKTKHLKNSILRAETF